MLTQTSLRVALKQRVVPGSGTQNKCSESESKTQPPTGYHLPRARINMAYVGWARNVRVFAGTTVANCNSTVRRTHEQNSPIK
jgi:hypothetical protein